MSSSQVAPQVSRQLALRLRDRASGIKLIFCCLILLIVTALPYLGCLNNGFSWIEPGEILDGAMIIHSWRELYQVLTLSDNTFAGYHRPIYNMVLSLDWHLWGNNPKGHHASTLVFHLANTLLVFCVFRKLLVNYWGPLAIAALWGLLPVNSAVVSMIVGKSDVVPFFFLSLTLFFAAKLNHLPKEKSGTAVAVIAACGLSYFLGILSKESVLPLPFFLALIAFFPNHFGLSHTRNTRLAVVLSSVLVGITIAYIAYRISLESVVPQETTWSLADRMLTFVSVYGDYLTRSLTAIELTKNDAVIIWSQQPEYWKSVVTVVCALLIQAWIYKSIPTARLGLIWFHLFLVLVSQIFPILHFRADRFLYLPSLGMIWTGVAILQHISQEARLQKFVVGGVISVLVFSAMRIHARMPDFLNDQTHFEPLVKKYPYCREAQSYLALTYHKQGEVEKENEAFERALKNDPSISSFVDEMSIYGNYSSSLMSQGYYEEAYEILRVQIRPYYKAPPQSYFNLGVCAKNLGYLDQAIFYLSNHLNLKPNHPSTLYLLGECFSNIGGNTQAIVFFQQYLEVSPQAVDASAVKNIILQLQRAAQ